MNCNHLRFFSHKGYKCRKINPFHSFYVPSVLNGFGETQNTNVTYYEAKVSRLCIREFVWADNHTSESFWNIQTYKIMTRMAKLYFSEVNNTLWAITHFSSSRSPVNTWLSLHLSISYSHRIVKDSPSCRTRHWTKLERCVSIWRSPEHKNTRAFAKYVFSASDGSLIPRGPKQLLIFLTG